MCLSAAWILVGVMKDQSNVTTEFRQPGHQQLDVVFQFDWLAGTDFRISLQLFKFGQRKKVQSVNPVIQ